jgi:hypothetical protein
MVMRIRNSVIAIVGSLVVAGGLSAVALASGTITASRGPSPEKQVIIQREQQLEAAAARQPHGAKHPEQKPALSCRVKAASQIYPFRFGPFYGGRNLVNVASAVSSTGAAYRIYAGAVDSDAQQGVMIVERSGDPCASAAGLAPAYIRAYLAARAGALTITGIAGDTVTFETLSGARGTFNYVTGQYS